MTNRNINIIPAVKIASDVKKSTKELDLFEEIYKDFNFDNFKIDKENKMIYVSLKKKGESDFKLYEVSNIIYPSKYFRDKITGKTKIEVTYLIKNKFYKKLIEDKYSAVIEIMSSFGFFLRNNDEVIQKHFKKLFQDMCAHLTNNTNESYLISQLGMQKDGSFACGKIYVDKDGSVTDCDVSDDLLDIASQFEPKGEREKFVKSINSFLKVKDMDKHKLYFLVLISTPMLSLLDLKGSFVNFQSTGTSYGKSLSQIMAQGFYRNRTQLDNKFTPLAVLKECGLVNSFPVILEEITNQIRDKKETVLEFIHDITGGTDKKRLDKNAKSVKTNEFRVNLGTSSNTSLFTIIKQESQAELVRTLEIPVTYKNQDSLNFVYSLIKKDYMFNCGHGSMVIEYMLKKKQLVADTYDEDFSKIINRFGSYDFRYIATSLTCALTFAKMLKALGFEIDTNEIKNTIDSVIDETLLNFNKYKVTVSKVIDILLSLKVNHYSEVKGKGYIINENIKQISNNDAFIIDMKKLVIPKSFFDTRVTLSGNSKFKPLFEYTSKEMIDFLNSDKNYGEICSIKQMTFEGKRIQCVVINLPLEQCASFIQIVNSKEEQEEIEKVFK